MKADFHIHTNFSVDSEYTPEQMILSAMQKGLHTICITDHCDLDYIEPGWELNFETYFDKLYKVKKKYTGQLEVLFGVEFGMQTHLQPKYEKIVKKYPFDFVIGSMHLYDGKDPYYPGFFDGKKDEECFRRAFELTLDNVRNMTAYDTLGHMDYIVRYSTYKELGYSYKKNADFVDEILKCLIQQGKGLEVNTTGWKSGLSFAHPHSDILKRYKEFGGEVITIGSDAHKPEHVAYDFHRIKDYLESCGFKYYTEFRQRKPYFCAL